MKTIKVKPILIESKVLAKIGDIVKSKFEDIHILTKNDSKEYAKTTNKQELIFISLEDEILAVGDLAYNSFHTNEGVVLVDNAEYYTKRKQYVKVIARQSQIPSEYISKFIKQYNDGCVEDLKIEMDAYTNKHKCCKKDMKVELPETIVCNICGAKGVDLINGVKNLITHYIPKLTNSFMTIVEKESCDKCKNTCKKTSTIGEFGSCDEFEKKQILYSEEQVEQLCWQAFINYKCIDGKIKSSEAESLIESFNKWFNENRDK